MEWKKDNTDSEKLRLMEKEYIEAALRMMKRAGIAETNVISTPEEKKVEEDSKNNDELHSETEKTKEAEEKYEEEIFTAEENQENIAGVEEENIAETKEEIIEEENENGTEDEFTEEQEDISEDNEAKEEEHYEDEEERFKGDYGVYTAEEILNGDGFVDAERIIEEIKMQNETMKKLTEEQEKISEQPRICPKCGKIIDGST